MKIHCPLCGTLQQNTDGKPIHPARDKEIKQDLPKILSGQKPMEHVEIISDKK